MHYRNPYEGIDKKIDLARAGAKAKAVLDRDEIKMEVFVGTYGQARVSADKGFVGRREREYERKDTPEDREKLLLSRIFEAIIHLHAELSEWFGSSAFTIKASRYDDIKNGVDEILELRMGRGAAAHLALAIDITFSPDIRDKIVRIKEEIQRGELARIDYFVSEYMHFKGELFNVPRVVIGADAKTVEGLADLWLNDKMRELGRHPIQMQILEEILLQLKKFQEYADSLEKHELVVIYGRSESLIRSIYEKKQGEIEDFGERDTVFESIRDNLKEFGQI